MTMIKHGSSVSAISRNPQRCPLEKRPPVLRANEVGTFAYDTMTRRIRTEILQRIFDENDWTSMPEVVHSLEQLRKEMENFEPLKSIQSIENEGDIESWNEILNPIITKKETWITAPWLISEFYFYRRVCEAVAFNKFRYDPFENQKRAALRNSHQMAKTLILKTQNLIKATLPYSHNHLLSEDVKYSLRLGLLGSLWGNQSDLSLWPSDVCSKSIEAHQGKVKNQTSSKTPPKPGFALEADDYKNLGALTEHLLADDFEHLWNNLIKRSVSGETLMRKVDLITDNAGVELISDFCLVSILIELKLTDCVTLRVKSIPLFVSDVMVKDIQLHIDELKKVGGHSAEMACDWQRYIDSGKVTIEGDDFFCLPTPLWDMPSVLWDDLHRNTDLVIVKGDANYRRLTEDRQWELDFPFDIVVETFPTRVLALRTLKSESGVGMDIQRVCHAKEIDSTWMVNGRWGVMQFAEGWPICIT